MSHAAPATAAVKPLSNPSVGYNPPALAFTPHPVWMQEMIGRLQPAWDAASWPTLYRRTADGALPPIDAWRRMLKDAFVIVENFPKYMGLTLAKTTYGHRAGDTSVRRWLLQNLMVESRHADWYIDWMDGLGVRPEEALAARPTPAFQALHEHLMETCRTGTLAEGVAASNWAIEGVTGAWTPPVFQQFPRYEAEGAKMDAKALRWLKAHAKYDDTHPEEALEIIKLYADETTPARIEAAAKRSLELFAVAAAGY